VVNSNAEKEPPINPFVLYWKLLVFQSRSQCWPGNL